MIPTLQSLRFPFVLLIFLSHFSYKEVNTLDAGGDCGVAFFFMLSGFVLSAGYGSRLRSDAFSYSRFLRRRLLKVFPLHWLCLLAFLLVVSPPIDHRLVLNALLLQSWVPQADCYFSYNAVSWFLSSVLCCYALFPLLFRYASRRLLAVVIAFYTLLCLAVPYAQVNAILYVFPLVRVVDFFLGICLYRYYERHKGRQTSTFFELLCLAVVVALLVAHPHVDAKLRTAALFWPVLLPLILVFAWGGGAVSRLLSTKPLLLLGRLTMPFFLTHQMAISFLTRRLPDMPYGAMLLVCVAIVVAISWCVDVFFLQPLQRRITSS